MQLSPLPFILFTKLYTNVNLVLITNITTFVTAK